MVDQISWTGQEFKHGLDPCPHFVNGADCLNVLDLVELFVELGDGFGLGMKCGQPFLHRL
jgi:hypothetical protein